MKNIVSDIKGPHRAFASSFYNAPVSHTVFHQLFNASFIGTAEQPKLIRHENIKQGNGGWGVGRMREKTDMRENRIKSK